MQVLDSSYTFNLYIYKVYSVEGQGLLQEELQVAQGQIHPGHLWLLVIQSSSCHLSSLGCHCCIWSSIWEAPSVRGKRPCVSVQTAYGLEVEGFALQCLKLILTALMVLKVEAKVLTVLRVHLLEL